MKQASEIIKNRHYYRTLESSYICYIAQNIIDDFFPDKKISVISYKNGNLKIKAENNYLLSELRLKQTEIILEINKKLQKKQIKNFSLNN